jgi:hypothetical protein
LSLGVIRRVSALPVVLISALVLVGAARGACPLQQEFSLSQRFEAADAAVVARVVAVRAADLQGAPQRVLTMDVEQRVKGDLPMQIVVWSPRGTPCDLRPKAGKAVGLLLARSPDGKLVASGGSVVDPGLLVAEGGEPRGGVIKVGVGIVVLALVLLWALRRLRKGARPDLPGAPRP